MNTCNHTARRAICDDCLLAFEREILERAAQLRSETTQQVTSEEKGHHVGGDGLQVDSWWYARLCARIKTHWQKATTKDWKKVTCSKCKALKVTFQVTHDDPK